MTPKSRFYIIDAHAYLHRAYHALPPLTNAKGEPVGALYGFARMLLKLIRREKPDLLAVCFDAPGPTFRHKTFKDYKATRKPTEPDLKSQLALAREMVSAMGLSAAEAPGWEADDLMATLARRAAAAGMGVTVVSGDKDALQLVGGPVRVLNEAKDQVMGEGEVVEKFGVRPDQLVDYLALTGDSSDNVPGVRGIGAVGAAKLLQRFGSLEGLFVAARKGDPDLPEKAAAALRESEESARMGRELVTLDAAAPVPFEPSGCRLPEAFDERLAEMSRRFGFNSILKELGETSPAGDRALSRGSAASEAVGAAAEIKEAPAKEVLKEAVRAERFGVAARRSETEDLVEADLFLAFALPDGRACALDRPALKESRAQVERLLSGKSVKVGWDLKAAAHALRPEGLRLSAPVADAQLAAYCLDPAAPRRPEPKGLREAALADAAAAVSGSEKVERDLEAKGLDKVYRELELPLQQVLERMEERGIAVDAAYLERLKREFEDAIAGVKAELDKLAGTEINLNSTKQLAVLLFDKLQLPVVHKTGKGGRSTDEDTLRVLAAQHEFPARLIDYRELTKLKSTYIDGLLARVDPRTGRVHTRYSQVSTATGRLASSDPNLQNIPVRTASGQKIRRAFVAGKGLVLLSADYSQIELRILAHLAKDRALSEAFRRGDDIHAKTAAEVFGVPADKVDKEMRRRAKAVNFGIVYGQTAHGLSQELGIPMAEAKEYIERYKARYPGVDAWMKEVVEAAKRDGFVRTLSGRIRYIPELAAKNFAVRSFGERVAVNTPIQGSSADIIKAAMIVIDRRMERGDWKGRLLLQVHDELVFEVPKAEAARFGAWVRREMESAARLDVPVAVDLKVGPNWQDMEEQPA